MTSNIILPGEIIQTFGKIAHRKADLDSDAASGKYKALRSGLMIHSSPQLLKFDPLASQYIPSLDDKVVGLINRKTLESYELDIKASRKAVLGSLEFEEATKKNKPDLYAGDIVFSRVKDIDKYLPIELTCTSHVNKKGWSSGEAQFGKLSGGMEITVPLFFSRYLLFNEEMFEFIRKRIDFEVCVGINGVIWVKTRNHKNLVLLNSFFAKAAYIGRNKAMEMLYGYADQFEA